MEKYLYLLCILPVIVICYRNIKNEHNFYMILGSILSELVYGARFAVLFFIPTIVYVYGIETGQIHFPPHIGSILDIVTPITVGVLWYIGSIREYKWQQNEK